MIPGAANPLLLASAAGAAGYQIERSIRLNAPDSAYLSRTPSATGNRKTWTWAGWVKQSKLGTFRRIFTRRIDSNNQFSIFMSSGNVLQLQNIASGAANASLTTSQVFRDLSAWLHLVAQIDTTQATASNRLKFYINGAQITQFSASTYPSQNLDLLVNANALHEIGAIAGTETFDGYLADIHFIDGQALTPTSFGEFDANGVWQPIEYTGSYPGNSFHLDFADNSAATTAGIGKDVSGNGNDWTPVNLSVAAGAGNDSLVDTPTSYGTDTGAGGEVRGNYCTLNPLANTGGSLLNGNLESNLTTFSLGTLSVNSGKWYYEATKGDTGDSWVGIGYGPDQAVNAYRKDGTGYNGGTWQSLGWSPYTNGDTIGVAFNLDTLQVTYYKNGVQQGSLSINAAFAGRYLSYISNAGVMAANFGQRPFAYPAPSGFKALCTTNLPDPVVAKPSEVMDVKLYTGNGSTQTISGLGFSPDLVWIKNRAAADNHKLLDTIRGATSELESNTTDAEVANTDGLTAFNSNGFDLGADVEYNTNAEAYVAWAWDAGSSTVTNTQGSITSQVRANPSAGFSIVTYTQPAGAHTVGHGLGAAPRLIITKARNLANTWFTYSSEISADAYLGLNTTAGATTYGVGIWNSTRPTSNVFSVGTDLAGHNYVAYCFAPVDGYSSFGSYTGNGSADGPFVYTGFRARWIMIKNTSAATNWILLDSRRLGYNGANPLLFPDSAALEAPGEYVDLLANGFKSRGANVEFNNNTQTYIYAAFAEHPFQYARAR